MAKTKISEFSTTAGNNTDINSINIAEGCSPSGINDAIRELMRQLKEFQTGGAGDSVNSGGDFSVATNKFTVASASGNTSVAGTLGVTGTTTLTGALVANGNATLGDASGDTVTIKGTPTLEVNPTLSGGTANGVLYLNGSKVATSGSALTFDGTNLAVGSATAFGNKLYVAGNINSSDTIRADLSTAGTSLILTGTGSNFQVSHATSGFATLLNSGGGLIFSPSGSEAMRMTSSSLYTASGINVGIGTSSPQTRLEANQTGVGSVVIPIVAANQDTSVTGTGAGIGFVVDGVNDVIGAQIAGIRTGAAYHQSALAMYTRDSVGSGLLERLRLDSSGNLLVGATSDPLSTVGRLVAVNTGAGKSAAVLKNDANNYATANLWNADTSGDNNFLFFATETTLTARGSITYNRAGGLVAYNTTSDYRAKDISGPIVDSGVLIDSVPVYIGKMKGATQERPMFIAHETPAYAHTGEKDAVDAEGNPVYQQMDASALIPVMWAEIQSLRARVAALES